MLAPWRRGLRSGMIQPHPHRNSTLLHHNLAYVQDIIIGNPAIWLESMSGLAIVLGLPFKPPFDPFCFTLVVVLVTIRN